MVEQLKFCTLSTNLMSHYRQTSSTLLAKLCKSTCTYFCARKRLRLAILMRMQLILKYACQFMTQQNQRPWTHTNYACICTYVQYYIVSHSQPTILYWLCLYNTNVYGLGTLSTFHYIDSLGKFRPLRLLACIVIMSF